MFSPKTKPEALALHLRTRPFKSCYFRSENEAIDLIGPLLGASAIAVYHILCRHARGDIVRMSVSQIVDSAGRGCSRATVFRVLDDLALIGALERRSSSGQTNEYALFSLKGRTPAELKAKLKARHERPVSEADGSEIGGPSLADAGVISRRVGTRLFETRGNKEDKTQDCKTELPPTPLLEEGDSYTADVSDKTRSLLTEFKMQLKSDMLTDSFRARHLNCDDYDKYFRDAWFLEIREGVIVVDAEDRQLIEEGLGKYARRLKQTFKRVAAVDVEFQLAPSNTQQARRTI